MHDFFVSYAHEEGPRAQAVVAQLRRLGQTVWLDEAPIGDDGDQLAGIPAGQRHWDVIQAGIDQAATFLALDSAAWRRSGYCRRELEHARAVGKRVASLGRGGEQPLADVHAGSATDDPADVLRALEPGDEAARAHARLHAELVGASGRRSWTSTLLQTREQTRDAELVSTADPSSTGLTVSPGLAEFCRSLLAAGRRRRRTLRSVLAGGLAVVLVLALLAVLGRQTTVSQRDQAGLAAGRAVSLQLASKALSASSTASGLSLARQAVRSQSTSAARGVLVQLESRARYLRQASVRPFAYLAAAVSADGGTAVLANLDSFVVVDMRTGSSRSLAAPESIMMNRVVLSPDGTEAYAMTQRHDLLCIDVPKRNIQMAVTSDVADLAVQPDGSLWWATAGGDVVHTHGCPGDSSAERYRVPSSVGAFAVLPQGGGLAVMSADYVLSTYALPAVPAGTTQAQQLVARSAVPLAGLSSSDPQHWSVDATRHGPDQVLVCGSTLHVAAETGGTSSLFSGWYARFDLAGAPAGGRAFLGPTQGLACSPEGGAWGVPGLTTRAHGLPDGSAYPVGVVDGQDAGSEVVVADSADHSHTVVVHSGGRVDVLESSTAPWGRTVGTATVAIPVSEGTVVVDDDGSVHWQRGAADTVVGRVGAPPAPSAVVALPGRALVGSGTSVVELTANGVGRSLPVPVPVDVLSSSPDGSQLVLEGEGRWFTTPASLGGQVQEIRPPGLSSGETITSLTRDGDRLVTGTTFGRLVVSTLEGKALHEVQIRVAGPVVSVVRRDHGVAAIGQDGILRSYDASLRLERSVMFGAGGLALREAADGRTLVLALTDFSVWAGDPTSLQVQQAVGQRSTDIRRILPSAGSDRIVRLVPPQVGTVSSTPAAVESFPLHF